MLGSCLLYILSKQKQKKEHDWRVMSVRTSSFPPPNILSIPATNIVAQDTLESVPVVTALSSALPKKLVSQKYSLVTQPVPEKQSTPAQTKREKDNTQDSLQVTTMTNQQLDDYLESSSSRYHSTSTTNLSNNSTMVYSEALRLASLDPEEVVYINDSQWFHPSACEFYPSQTTVGEELLMTIKGSWILKKPGINVPSAYTYQVVSKKDAFIFLESNGFAETAQALAPHNPSCEV